MVGEWWEDMRGAKQQVGKEAHNQRNRHLGAVNLLLCTGKLQEVMSSARSSRSHSLCSVMWKLRCSVGGIDGIECCCF